FARPEHVSWVAVAELRRAVCNPLHRARLVRGLEEEAVGDGAGRRHLAPVRGCHLQRMACVSGRRVPARESLYPFFRERSVVAPGSVVVEQAINVRFLIVLKLDVASINHGVWISKGVPVGAGQGASLSVSPV